MTDATRSSYDRVAARYQAEIADELRHKPYDRALLRAFAELAGAGPVADLGAGPGHVAAELAGQDVAVSALDLSPAMCRLAAPGVAGRACAGDLTALPLRSSSLAGIVCLYAVIHLDEAARGAAYREMARALRQGGLALIAFHTGDAEHRPGTTKALTTWWDTPVELTFRFLDPDAEITALETAGLELAARLDRAPHAGTEHPSRRSYLVVQRP